MAIKQLDLNKPNRRTLFVGCEKAAIETAQPFSKTQLETVENILSQALLPYEKSKRGTDASYDSCNAFSFFRKVMAKIFQFKQKFFNVLFQKFVLCRKASKPYQIVCLCIEYNIDPAADEPVHTTKI